MPHFPSVKIEVYIPEQYVERLRDELYKANAGRVGNYDHCISVTQVKGYWRPLPGSTPYQGEVGRISEGTECKVEVNCKQEYIGEALKAIRRIHPYDEPLINVIPLMNHLFEDEK